ncbi:MAG: SH3 domain-containing protein, partial [Candidatus Promineofilum sp.]|nr:SH3 domain-containing protein [Promineifilum sp.]
SATESGATVLPASPTPEATAAATATTPVQTATVSSGVGVWLRGAPSTTGEQLEWLLDGTVVTLLPGQQTADDLLWQQVRTEAGVEGWVARDFLTVEGQ